MKIRQISRFKNSRSYVIVTNHTVYKSHQEFEHIKMFNFRLITLHKMYIIFHFLLTKCCLIVDETCKQCLNDTSCFEVEKM